MSTSTVPEPKAADLADLNALFADFDASFGKAATKKAVAAERATARAAKPKAAAVNPHLSESRTANTLRNLLGPESVWRPVAVTAQIVEQSCRCCGGSTKYLGNVTVTHEHKRTRALWSAQIPESPAHSELPHEVAYHTMRVEQCASCIEIGLRMSELAAQPECHQLSLFS